MYNCSDVTVGLWWISWLLVFWLIHQLLWRQCNPFGSRCEWLSESSEWDTVWLTLQSTQAFFTATNYATINLRGVSWLHWSQSRDSGFQLVRDMKGGGGDECPWASAWWIGQGVDEESGMVRLCANRHQGPRCRGGWKEDSSQLKGWKERD